jgi:ComF family protein
MIASLLDFISPRSCRICGKRLSLYEQEICTVCNRHLPRTYFAEIPFDNNMSRLFWGKFNVGRVAALYFYESHSPASRLIYDLKYHGKRDLGLWLGSIVAKEFSAFDFFEDIDFIVPVPITWRRKWKRGYNQSYVIACGVADVTGIPIRNNLLKRVHFSCSQTRLLTSDRLRNVEGAFSMRNKEDVSGKHILLIDDIVTTGATVSSCAKELEKAGSGKISVLSIGCTKI